MNLHVLRGCIYSLGPALSLTQLQIDRRRVRRQLILSLLCFSLPVSSEAASEPSHQRRRWLKSPCCGRPYQSVVGTWHVVAVPERAAKQAPGFHFCRMFQLAPRAEPKLEATSKATNVRLSSEGTVVLLQESRQYLRFCIRLPTKVNILRFNDIVY